jgi:predicted nuclease of predicted toxin-antitoxin system
MKFLADENISNKVVNALRNKGVDIISIKDIEPSLSDETVLEVANKHKRIVITFDADFAELVFRRRLKAKGVILLKFVPESTQDAIEKISNVLATQAKIEGHFLIVKENRIRVLRLK